MTSDPRKFVKLWLTKHNITIDARGNLQTEPDRDNTEIFKSLYLDYCEQITAFNYKTDKKIKREGKDMLQDAFDELIAIHIREEQRKLIARITFCGAENIAPLTQYILAVTGKTD